MMLLRVVRLEIVAAVLILLGTVGLMVGLFAGSPSILSDLQVQRQSDGVGVRQKKIYDAILVAAKPDSDPDKSAELRQLEMAKWSFYDIEAVRAPASWQWGMTVTSGFLILIGQAIGAIGSMHPASRGAVRRRFTPAK